WDYSLSSHWSKAQAAQEVKDEDKLYRYKGVLYPRIMCPEENLKALESVEAREDDILLVAYPKCGFNWVDGVLTKIMAAGMGKQPQTLKSPLLEFFGPDMLQVLDQVPSPRLLGLHLHPDNIPTSFYTKKTKMVVVFRNPKDTAVSYFHFCNGNPVLPSQSWETFYPQFLTGDVPWGSYFDHALAWDKKIDDPSVLIVTYEELKQDLSEGVRQISSFLGFSLTDPQIQKISEDSTFKAMKKTSASSHGRLGDVVFRKGEVGDWKNHFTAEQSQEMDRAFSKHGVLVYNTVLGHTPV
uniref:Sulfotransferase n=1 Tax=Myripristis murdjan TaxID=586833 RepID=A0A667XWB5_9TELE